MKITLINKQKIIRFVLISYLLLTVSCDSCMRKPLDKARDQAKLTLNTYSVVELGSINKDQLVIEVHGEIQENYINEPSTLCVLVIPKNDKNMLAGDLAEVVGAAATEFRLTKKILDKNNPYVVLPTSKGVIYYDSELSGLKKGPVVVKAFLQGGLQPGGYQAYLIVHNVSHGTYFSIEGKDFEIPTITDAGPIPIIEMKFAKAKRTINDDSMSFIRIKTAANAENFANRKGGFLFIEKQDPQAKPIDLLVELIKNREAIPITTDFKQLREVPDIIMCSFTSSDAAAKFRNTLLVNDTNKIFKKGATYQVYAYLVDENSGYIISQEDNPIHIPKLELKLEMQAASIADGMVKDLSIPRNLPEDKYNKIHFNLTGRITEHKGTYKPKVGFLFVPKKPVDSTGAAIVKVNNLFASPVTNNFHKLDNDLVYVADKNMPTGTIGELSYDLDVSNTSLDLNENYYVYFWLQDGGGDIFVSAHDQGIQLCIPKVNLEIKHYATLYIQGKFKILPPDYKVEFPSSLLEPSEKRYTGFLFVKDGISIDHIAIFEKVLQAAKDRSELEKKDKKKKNPKAVFKSIQGKEIIYQWDKLPLPSNTTFKQLFDMQDGIQYRVYLWAYTTQGNAIFYKKSNQKFDCYSPVNEKIYVEETLQPDASIGLQEVTTFEIAFPEQGSCVACNASNHYILRIDNENRVKIDPHNFANEALIEAILRKGTYRGQDSVVREEIKKYIENMKK